MSFFEKKICPITGETYTGIALVIYNIENNVLDGLIVSPRTVRKLTRETLAERVYDHLIKEGELASNISVEQILDLNPKCMIIEESLLERLYNIFSTIGFSLEH